MLKESWRRFLADELNNQTAPPTFIGLHVRRGDYANALWTAWWQCPVEKEFYFDALNHFRQKFKNPVFMVTSDDILWAKSAFKTEKDVIIAGLGDVKLAINSNIGCDLALMSVCNHTIFDYGSFGLFSALLAGGN